LFVTDAIGEEDPWTLAIRQRIQSAII